MEIGFTDFPTGNRDDAGAVIGCPFKVFQAQEIEGGHGGVEVKMQGLAVACLTVTQAGELLGVAEQELNLKAGLVKEVNVLGGKTQVGREKQGGLHPGTDSLDQVYDAHVALEACAELVEAWALLTTAVQSRVPSISPAASKRLESSKRTLPS